MSDTKYNLMFYFLLPPMLLFFAIAILAAFPIWIVAELIEAFDDQS